MITAYIVAAGLGATFIALSALLGWMGGAHGVGDAHADVGAGTDVGHDFSGGGHGDASGADAAGGDHDMGSAHLPLFSPMALAALVTGFGAAGLVATSFLGDRPALHVPVAAVGGAAMWVGMSWVMLKLLIKLEGPSTARALEIYRQDVEVTVPIPSDGFGEVAYVAGGTRHTLPARGEPGVTFGVGQRVRVTRVLDGTALVRPLDALQGVDGVSEERRGS